MAEEQYFAASPHSESQATAFLLQYGGRAFRFLTDSGVFSKGELDQGTRTLLDALPARIGGSVLDLGCGWGPVGVIIGALHPQAAVMMTDVNERAVSLARQNAQANGVPAQVGQSDGFEQIRGRFHLIALNPPIRAGKETVYRLFRECALHLHEDGAVYIVIRKQQGAASAAKYLEGLFRNVETVARKAGFHVIKCDGGRPDGV
ncbi:MAG: class I SAM-dependent methyltransferase [Christensenellales bacterium]